MISFRKHATESTRRPNSLLRRRAGAAVLLSVLLVAPLSASAAPRQPPQQAEPQKAQAQKTKTAPAAAAPVEEAKIPIRVTRVETPDGPGVVATIGEFPSDLNDAGAEFLKREFFEHFASDVLGLGESVPGATLKVAMLPQEKDNQRECDFTVGKVSGHIVVLVEKRRVLVACTFAEAAEHEPGLLATAEGMREVSAAGD
jgi:hypothetical protein